MNKVLVEVYVPAIGKTYDVYIPLTSKMSEVKFLLVKAIEDLAANDYVSMNDVLLCDYSTGKEYDINLKVCDLKIDNGSKIMLV